MIGKPSYRKDLEAIKWGTLVKKANKPRTAPIQTPFQIFVRNSSRQVPKPLGHKSNTNPTDRDELKDMFTRMWKKYGPAKDWPHDVRIFDSE